jgi:hypothetical protein
MITITHTVKLALALVTAGFAVLGALACDDDTAQELALLGESCNLNSQCDGALVCVFGRCHEECRTTADCPGNQHCISAEKPLRVCQLPDQTSCTRTSDCPEPLVCGIDGICRNQCNADRDCVPGQVCVTATCAEPDELVAGRLPPSPDVNPVGTPCRYSSDCPVSNEGLELVCKNKSCAYGCFEERDCPRFYRCNAAPPAPGECELIGTQGNLYCDPDDDPPEGHPCACPDGSTGRQFCRSDGSGYQPCECQGP